MERVTAEEIVGGALVEGKKETVYCLGPFPSRVNFTSQQHRALNLVSALRVCNKFAPDDSVAVIGAGLAGLSAAAAFISHGCYVDVYGGHGHAIFQR
jgi:pyruvate/2-oxoglutarate dehydrogenase complex dihydrolipoamide dehydrogenase (E3) component